MSFSKEVKKLLYDMHENTYECCKSAFEAGSTGKEANIKCKRCKIQYVAGVFYSYGTMSAPSKGYQLFLYPPAGAWDSTLSILSETSPPNVSEIKGKKCLYYKGSENVGDFLAYCKATAFAMRVYEQGVVSSEKSRIQRECNAEVANMQRAADAAEEHLSAIRILKKHNMMGELKKELVEAAELREAYPEAGLSQLVSLANFPISKSGLNYRLKQLVAIAKRIKAEEKE